MYTFNEFLLVVKERILGYISEEGFEIIIRDIAKGNNIRQKGLMVINPKKPDSYSPVIYLEEHYSIYINGLSIEMILERIAELYHTEMLKIKKVNLSNSDNIIINLINKENNIELLKDVPHLEFEDLAIVFRYLCSQTQEGIRTILLKRNLLNNCDINELYKIALDNTVKKFGISIKTLQSAIQDMQDENIEPVSFLPMHVHVITNEIGINGATILLMTDTFKTIANELDDDLYILPSSIHELIATPVNKTDSNVFKDIVKSINESQVALEERLSNNIYRYNRSSNKINIC